MARVLMRVGRWAFRRRWWVLASWLVLLAGLGILAGAVKVPANAAGTVPGTQSQQALDLLDSRFPGTGGTQAQVVFAAPAGHRLTTAADRAAIEKSLASLRHAPQVVAVTDPFTTKTVSANGQIAYATVAYAVPVSQVTSAATTALQDSGGPARAAGITVDFGGQVISATSSSGTEGIGVAVAFLVLLATFGSLIAAGLPLLTALVGVAAGLLAISALSPVITETSTTPVLALMIGLAVGIDYALFIVTRHREQLAAGVDPETAAATAVATAGSAVCFAGATVTVALAGLTVVGIPFLSVMGLCGAGTVLIAVAIAVTLVPALLGIAGKRVSGGRRASARARRTASPGHRTAGRRWAELVTRVPALTLLAGIAGLLVIATPALHLQLGLPSAAAHPVSDTDRRAYDLISQGFGPGANGPLLLVTASSQTRATATATASMREAVTKLPDVAGVTPARLNPARDVSIVTVIPKTGPSAQATRTLVSQIRATATSHQAAGAQVYVTGTTAVDIDTAAALAAALPVYLAVVAALCLLLLALVFRSVLIPVKAVIGYLLSVAAALGAVTWVFQDGHLASLLSVPAAGPVLSYLPILLLGILFGLAMDYEFFLVTRMRDEYLRTGQARPAIISGYAGSARVVTAAAIIMISVFSGFILSSDAIVKSIGFALAFGVLADAFVVRLTLVPATLALLGRTAWWLPARIDRLLPGIDIEGHHLEYRATTRTPAHPDARTRPR